MQEPQVEAQEKASEVVDNREEGLLGPGFDLRESSAPRINQLFEQAEAVKMVIFRRFLEAENKRDPEDELGVMKLSQQVLRAIEVQLDIMNHEGRLGNPVEKSPSVEKIWSALLALPGIGPLLAREPMREKLIAILKEEKEKGGRGE